jgi:hypothetical protein
MHNCIFTPYCLELFCDKSCPILAETSYLLERNDISMTSNVFRASDNDINKMVNILDNSSGKLVVDVVKGVSTIEEAELLTYCAICRNWRGSQLHCNVYNLKYSKYVDELKKSWSTREDPESLEYMKIWSETAKVLVVSNLDYVNFGDFESQTLLNLIQSRQISKLTTIIVTPPINMLISSKSSRFFSLLANQLSEAAKVVVK